MCKFLGAMFTKIQVLYIYIYKYIFDKFINLASRGIIFEAHIVNLANVICLFWFILTGVRD